MTAELQFFDKSIQEKYPIGDKENTMYLKTIERTKKKEIDKKESCSFISFQKSSNSNGPFLRQTNNILTTNDLNQKKKVIERKNINEHNFMYNDDIPFSRSKTVKLIKNREIDDKLLPIEFESANFIKDPLNLKDIDGAESNWRSKQKQLQSSKAIDKAKYISHPVTTNLQQLVFREEANFAQKEVVKKNKIERNNVNYDTLNVKDISKPRDYRLSNRCVDPNNPDYFYYDINRNPSKLNPIEKSTSSIKHPVTLRQQYNLETKDINGATSSLNARFPYDVTKIENPKNPNDSSDISCTKAGSLKKTLKTKRCINPNDRLYELNEKYLKGFEIGTEYKNLILMSKMKHGGKKICKNSKYLNDINNWDFINQKVKDPSRPYHQIINHRKPGEFNKGLSSNLYNLGVELTTFKDISSTNNLPSRNIIVGEGVSSNEYTKINTLARTDEEKLENYKVILMKQRKRTSTQPQEFRINKHINNKTRTSNIPFIQPKLNSDFKVNFQEMGTVAQKLDMFINKI